jgi:hypothetical protein
VHTMALTENGPLIPRSSAGDEWPSRLAGFIAAGQNGMIWTCRPFARLSNTSSSPQPSRKGRWHVSCGGELRISRL